MAVIHGKNLDHSIAGLAVEDYTKEVNLNIENDVNEATAASATAKANKEGLYAWTVDADYIWASSSGELHQVLCQMLSSGQQDILVNPGGGAEGTNNPEYGGKVLLQVYEVEIPHDDIVTCRATYQGSSGLIRDVTA